MVKGKFYLEIDRYNKTLSRIKHRPQQCNIHAAMLRQRLRYSKPKTPNFKLIIQLKKCKQHPSIANKNSI
jgi:hypothetical protein